MDAGKRGMPKGGLEPPHPFEYNALNVACLPNFTTSALFSSGLRPSSNFTPDPKAPGPQTLEHAL